MGAGLKRARAAARATQRKVDIVSILRSNARRLLNIGAVVIGEEGGRVLAEVMSAAADEISRLRIERDQLKTEYADMCEHSRD